MGAQGANAMMGMAGQVGGTINPILEAGMDPQSALFNRTQGRLMDQTNAINSMSGLGGTPYGASVGANAMGNFDIRLAEPTACPADAGGGGGRQRGKHGGRAYGAAPGLMASTAGMPSEVYTGQIGQELQALQARNQGANQGIAGYGSLLGSAGQGIGQANAANLQGAQAYQQYGSAPYNTAAGIANNSVSGLSNLTQLGNNQFALPQQAISDLMQYMGLGQSASGLSGQLGNLGFQQTAQGLGGGLSALNMLGGQGGMLSGGGGGLGGAAAGGAFGGGGFRRRRRGVRYGGPAWLGCGPACRGRGRRRSPERAALCVERLTWPASTSPPSALASASSRGSTRSSRRRASVSRCWRSRWRGISRSKRTVSSNKMRPMLRPISP